MPDFKEFLGPSYTRPIGQTQAQCERTVNWRLELLPGSSNKNRYAMFRQPGLSTFCNTGIAGKVRGGLTTNGRTFAVVANKFIEIFSNGTITNHSTGSVDLTDNGRRAWIAPSPTQIMIVSGGNGYIFTLATNVLVQITAPDFPTGTATACEYLDGYFIVTIENSQQFQISALLDGLSWDALDFTSAESRPDFIVAPMALREEVWFFGTQTVQPYFNCCDPDFPFRANLSGMMQFGLLAAESVIRIGNHIFWLLVDDAGFGRFVRNDGYLDVTVSNHAIESVWRNYQNLDLAYSWAYEENGHACVRISFPNIDGLGSSATWEYDLSTDQWTETPYWNVSAGKEEAHRGYCSFQAFGKILVGDRENGKIYDFSSQYLDDAGDLIRRVRRAPHLYNQGKDIQYHRIEFDGNKGIGLNVASDQPYYNPAAILRWSNNGGRTFGTDYELKFGVMGAYGKRVFKAGCGTARDRVFELVCAGPVDWSLTGASLDYTVLA